MKASQANERPPLAPEISTQRVIHPSRRRFLALTGLAALGCLVPQRSSAVPLDSAWDSPLSRYGEGFSGARTLNFYNTHTGESLTTAYWRDGAYDPEALASINHILRDHRSGEIISIDTRLLDLLHTLRINLSTTEPIQVVSGYRSPATNERLRHRRRGVAKASLHMSGQAADIRILGLGLRRLRQAALELQAGGVGYYPRSGFVHVDVGSVRCW